MDPPERAYHMDGFDDQSPAMTNEKIRALQSKQRVTTYCVGFAVAFAFLAFVLGAFATTFVDKNQGHLDSMIDLHNSKSGVILRYGQAKLSGYRTSTSLFAGSGSWYVKPALLAPAGGRSDFIAVPSGDKIFLIGGNDIAGNAMADVTEYDTILETYTVKRAMPAARARFGAAIHDGKIYVVGGVTAGHDDNANVLSTTLVYDIADNTWTSGPALAKARSDTCVAVVGGAVHVVGGYSLYWETLNSTEVLDATASPLAWSAGPTLPAPRGDVTCAASVGHVFVFGGHYDPTASATSFNYSAFHATVFSLDVSKSATTWLEKAPMPNARGDKAAATLSDGSIIVVGGETHARGAQTEVALHDVEQYYPTHDTWVAKAPVPTARFRFGVAAVDDQVHAFGGHKVCSSYGDATLAACATDALDSHEVLMDVVHPDIWVHSKIDL
jgi:N-acetylneuraminic acid mutarotase